MFYDEFTFTLITTNIGILILPHFPLFGGWVGRWCWVGVLRLWISVGQGPTVLAVGAGGGCLDIFLYCRTIAVRDPMFKSQRSYLLDHGDPFLSFG